MFPIYLMKFTCWLYPQFVESFYVVSKTKVEGIDRLTRAVHYDRIIEIRESLLSNEGADLLDEDVS